MLCTFSSGLDFNISYALSPYAFRMMFLKSSLLLLPFCKYSCIVSDEFFSIISLLKIIFKFSNGISSWVMFCLFFSCLFFSCLSCLIIISLFFSYCCIFSFPYIYENNCLHSSFPFSLSKKYARE